MLNKEERNIWFTLLAWSFYLSDYHYLASFIMLCLCYHLQASFKQLKKEILIKQTLLNYLLLQLSLLVLNLKINVIFLMLLSLNLCLFNHYLASNKVIRGYYLWYFLTFTFYSLCILWPSDLFTLADRYRALVFISVIFLPLAFLYLIVLIKSEKELYKDSYFLK